MKFEEPQQLSLRGSLILADPSLRDPNFSRSVLLLTEHSSGDGAHGYILNRPLEKSVSDVLTDDDFGALGSAPVYLGGPVNTGQLTFASINWNPNTAELSFATHLSSTEAQEALDRGGIVRAFVGHSGWAEGQLESELMQRAWITHQAQQSVLKIPHNEALWTELLRSMGPWYRLLADMPTDPSLN